jgi:hypothetical protein
MSVGCSECPLANCEIGDGHLRLPVPNGLFLRYWGDRRDDVRIVCLPVAVDVVVVQRGRLLWRVCGQVDALQSRVGELFRDSEGWQEVILSRNFRLLRFSTKSDVTLNCVSQQGDDSSGAGARRFLKMSWELRILKRR